MQFKYLPLFIFTALISFTSCKTAYKAATPDDVYYSPEPLRIEDSVRVERDGKVYTEVGNSYPRNRGYYYYDYGFPKRPKHTGARTTNLGGYSGGTKPKDSVYINPKLDPRAQKSGGNSGSFLKKLLNGSSTTTPATTTTESQSTTTTPSTPAKKDGSTSVPVRTFKKP
jgi:hypothetical protein